jgi:hypothetical protein
MAVRAGGAYIEIRADNRHLQGDLNAAHSRVRASTSMMQREIGRISFTHVAIAAAAFSAAIVYGMKKAIDAASALQEVQGKFDVVFATQRQEAEAMAKVLVESYAMSTREAKQYMSSIQDLLVPMGMASDKALLMSNEVVKLSADLASFNNVPTAQAMADIQSALVGNFETMKKYGVVLNETVIKQEALRLGLWKGKGMVDANTKAQIAYELMLKGSTAAIGDQQRTMGSYANQMKLLKANVENIAAAIGDELLPKVTEWVVQLNTAIKQNPQIIKQIGEFAKTILDLASAMGKVIGLGVEFANVWVKTWQAMGLASIGMINFKTAITDGTTAVETFNEEMGPEKLRLAFLDKVIATGKFTWQVDREAKKLRELIDNRKVFLSELKAMETRAKGMGTYSIDEATTVSPTVSPTVSLTEEQIKAMQKQEDFAIKMSNLEAQRIKDREQLNIDTVEKFKIAKMSETDLALYALDKQFLAYNDFIQDKDALDGWYVEKYKEIMIAANAEKLAIQADFDTQYNEMGKSRYELEREQLKRQVEIWKEAEVSKEKIAELSSNKIKQIKLAETTEVLGMYSSMAGQVAETFLQIAQAGGKQSKEAFAMYKVFAIAQAGIAATMAILNALASPLLPPPTNVVMASVIGAMAAVQVAMIASAQPPSYDQGGISEAKGIYQTGNIREAHIPIPSGGKIPVKVEEEKEERTPINIINIADVSLLDSYLASSRGKNAILNIIGSQPRTIRRMLI